VYACTYHSDVDIAIKEKEESKVEQTFDLLIFHSKRQARAKDVRCDRGNYLARMRMKSDETREVFSSWNALYGELPLSWDVSGEREVFME
jgi:hypothetical protein